jgi:hypothetical protein
MRRSAAKRTRRATATPVRHSIQLPLYWRLFLLTLALALLIILMFDHSASTADPTNQPPRVDAGLDLAITQPARAQLDGRVIDDGRPSAELHAAWSMVSGPGAVQFEETSASATTASFAAAGVYVLRLTASDTERTAADEVIVAVRPNTPPLARSQEVATPEDTPLPIVLAGIDREGEPLRVAVAEPPAHGRLTGEPPQVVYQPEPDYHGVDGFRFTVADAERTSRPAAVGILITAVNDPPVARAEVAPTAGTAPLTVHADGTESADLEGPIQAWRWAFGDGAVEHEPATTHVYREPGSYRIELSVIDADGERQTDTVDVRVSAADAVQWSFEAERVHVSAPMRVVEDRDASGGRAIASPVARQGRARCAFTVGAAGDFAVWARVKAVDGKHAVLAVALDSQPPIELSPLQDRAGAWAWVHVLGPQRLEPGPHRLVLRSLQAGAALDRILVTNDPHVAFGD